MIHHEYFKGKIIGNVNFKRFSRDGVTSTIASGYIVAIFMLKALCGFSFLVCIILTSSFGTLCGQVLIVCWVQYVLRH